MSSPITELSSDLWFPPVSQATAEGLLAYGGDLEVARLLLAYQHGIFPWFSDDEPILWWSPPQRAVLSLHDFHISRSLRKTMSKKTFDVTFDTNFETIIRMCSAIKRNHETGTWIVPEMVEAYVALHREGYAHSVEVRCNGEIVGGLYGVSLGGMFFGESMFSLVSGASKVALATLAQQLVLWGFDSIDCQIYSGHFEQFGVRIQTREAFLQSLERTLQKPTQKGTWSNLVEAGKVNMASFGIDRD